MAIFSLKPDKPQCKGHHPACTTGEPSTLQACDLASFPHPIILMCPSTPSLTIPQCSWWTEVSQLHWDVQLPSRRRNTESTDILLLLALIYSPHIIYEGIYKLASSVVVHTCWWQGFWTSCTTLPQ